MASPKTINEAMSKADSLDSAHWLAYLLCKEPNQPMGSRKNILVVQALQVVQVALAMCQWTWEILCLLHSGMPVCKDFRSHNDNCNNKMQVRLNVLHASEFGHMKRDCPKCQNKMLMTARLAADAV